MAAGGGDSPEKQSARAIFGIAPNFYLCFIENQPLGLVRMKGIIKFYHPDETLKYRISLSHCKAVYANELHFLDLEIITEEDPNDLEEDSLKYAFPQLAFRIIDLPLKNPDLTQNELVLDEKDATFTELDLYCDEEAYLYDNHLVFEEIEGVLNLIWKGECDDFFTGTDRPVTFKLKCDFSEDAPEIAED